MNPELEIIIKERVRQLPIKVASAIKSVPWVDKMIHIAKDNNFDEEKEKLFITETTLLVFGIESPMKYPINLAEHVGLDDDAVIKIAKEVNDQIIMPITQMVEGNNSEQKKEVVPEKRREPIIPVSVLQPARQDLAGSTMIISEIKPGPIVPASVPPALTSYSAKAMPDKQEGSSMAMEIPPINLPMVEQPKAQPVQPARQDLAGSKASLPDYRYGEGKDPYREPLA